MTTSPSYDTSPECFGFFKHILFAIMFLITYLFLLIPSMVLLAFGTLYGLQLLQTIYVINDIIYSDIQRDVIGAASICIALALAAVASTFVVHGLVQLNIKYNVQPRVIYLSSMKKVYALQSFFILYAIEYVLLIISVSLYFLSYRVMSVPQGGYDILRACIQFISTYGSIVIAVLMIYNANIFVSGTYLPVIKVTK